MRRTNQLLATTVSFLVCGVCGRAQADNWTGLYLGAGGGFGMANHELDFSNGPLIPPPIAFDVNIDGLSGTGGLFTLGAGADYQINSKLLIGAFFDYDWTDINTEINASLSGLGGGVTANAQMDVENQWFLGGRIGYLATPKTLLFFSGGYMRVDISDLTFKVSAPGLGSLSGVLAGIGSFSGTFVGGGAEVKLTDAISIKAEYRYTNLGPEGVTLLPDLAPAINNFVTTKLDPTIQTARVTLNYRFGLGQSAAEPDVVSSADDGLTSSWTGFYIGAGGGYAMASHELDFSNGPLIPPPIAFDVNLDGLSGKGGLFTLGAGADYQINNKLLVGAFFDYDWTDINTEINASITGFGGGVTANAEFEVENQWSIGGRIGYLPDPRTLLFISAGYTRVDISDIIFSVTAPGLGSLSGVLASVGNFSGTFIGGGAEIRLTDALSIKGEYRYTNLGSESVTLLPDLAPAINDFVSTSLDPTIQTARVSLNYRFNVK
jgi:outer membrane immunogenic protein